MNIYEISDRTPLLERQLTALWERSVKATHLFLTDSEIAEIRKEVPQTIREAPHLLRACLKSPRACLGGVFSALTALKILAIRQDACGFLPCRAKNPLANPYTSRY